MATSIVTRVAGPTYAISVPNTQTTAINVVPSRSNGCTYAEFVNPGTTDVCVVIAQLHATPATPVLAFPVAGTPTVPDSFMLPHGMTEPRKIAVPDGGFGVSAIGSAVGPSIIYITPVDNQ